MLRMTHTRKYIFLKPFLTIFWIHQNSSAMGGVMRDRWLNSAKTTDPVMHDGRINWNGTVYVFFVTINLLNWKANSQCHLGKSLLMHFSSAVLAPWLSKDWSAKEGHCGLILEHLVISRPDFMYASWEKKWKIAFYDTGEKQWCVQWVNYWVYVDWRHYCSMISFTFVRWINLKYIQN